MASKAAEREAADLQATRDREHAAILRAATEPGRLWLTELAAVMRERAQHLEETHRAGWKGRRDGWNAAADHVNALIELLNANPAPTTPRREPLDTIPSPARHADLDPADGPVSARITDKVLAGGPVTPEVARRIRELNQAPDIDAKLDAAFGDRPALAGPDEPAPPWISAAFGGQCSGCGDRIDQGDEIRSDGSGGWERRECCGGLSYVDVISLPMVTDAAGRPTLAAPDPFVNWPPADVTRPRMTLTEVHEHGRQRRRGASHRSHSQITGFEECGVRYVLSDRERVPQWWNVGGNAVHGAIETINRVTQRKGVMPADALDDDTSQLWDGIFKEAVAETEYLSGVPHEAWRAASRGAEAYDWWRVEGELMVGRWVEYLRRRYSDGWTIHAIEQEYRLPVDGVPVPVLCILDAVFVYDADQEPMYEIVDIKAGKSAPREGFQIGGLYHWALWHGLNVQDPERHQAPDAPDVAQSFWVARQADPVNQTIEIVTTPWPEVVHRVSMMDRAERAGLYVPRPSNFCGSCAVNDLCPVGPR